MSYVTYTDADGLVYLTSEGLALRVLEAVPFHDVSARGVSQTGAQAAAELTEPRLLPVSATGRAQTVARANADLFARFHHASATGRAHTWGQASAQLEALGAAVTARGRAHTRATARVAYLYGFIYRPATVTN
ncbi:hypothetical protein [Halorhodospira sp. 9622]|uniref:hypothetical protein n=1 Tax=Halorhodospira sp. 9622 TaxID=2899136 RepID=UPI001EE81DC6|nr:hypothetical protein [Halorhodospira sp. 9622]MCG5537858.1 hypothetical protein [Halorhodospira sp. 9622]